MLVKFADKSYCLQLTVTQRYNTHTVHDGYGHFVNARFVALETDRLFHLGPLPLLVVIIEEGGLVHPENLFELIIGEIVLLMRQVEIVRVVSSIHVLELIEPKELSIYRL